MLARLLPFPAWRHDPRVLAAVVEIPLLRLGNRRLVPRMPRIDLVAERVLLDEERAFLDPIVVEGAAEENADPEVDLDEIGRDELAVDDDAGRDVHRAAPFAHRLVAEIAFLRVL